MLQIRTIDELIAAAQRALMQLAPSPTHKRILRSSAGKRYVVRYLLPLVPPHKRYVEPFAGGAALFFAKDRVDEEVLADLDPEIVFAYRFVQRMTPETLAALKGRYWKNSRAHFNKLKAQSPTNDVDRFYRFTYLNYFGYFKKPTRYAYYNPSRAGQVFAQFDKLLKGKERLQGVTVLHSDYEKVVRRFDEPDTFFFFDPPFPGYAQDVGEDSFDEERFVDVLHGLRGKFLATYGLRSDRSLFKEFDTRRIVVPTATPAGLQHKPLLLIANYEIRGRRLVPAAKQDRGQPIDVQPQATAVHEPLPAVPPVPPDIDRAMQPFYDRVVDLVQPIIKRGTDEERFTLGVVLVPDEVDSQHDRYSKEEVRRACHHFAEFYLNAGLMHREIANGRIVILQNYVAPADFVAPNGVHVKEGTWLQGRGYRDDEIWQRIKRGELTGLSIGGSAVRRPAAKGAAEDEASGADDATQEDETTAPDGDAVSPAADSTQEGAGVDATVPATDAADTADANQNHEATATAVAAPATIESVDEPTAEPEAPAASA